MTKGADVCQENMRHTIIPPLQARTRDTRQDAFMVFLPDSNPIPSECRSRNRDYPDQPNFFQSSIV